MNILQSFIGFLGRLCLSIIFIVAGVRILIDWQGSEHYFIATLCDWMTMTMGDESLQNLVEMAMNRSFLFLGGAAFCAIAGGLMVLFGMSVRLGAFMLLVFMIPATVLYHHFWTLQGVDRQTQMEMFIRNVSIIGGVFLLLAYGYGGSKKPKAKDKKADTQ